MRTSASRSTKRVDLYSEPLRVGRAFKLEVLLAGHTPRAPAFRVVYVPISTCHEIKSISGILGCSYVMVERWMCAEKGI